MSGRPEAGQGVSHVENPKGPEAQTGLVCLRTGNCGRNGVGNRTNDGHEVSYWTDAKVRILQPCAEGPGRPRAGSWILAK